MGLHGCTVCFLTNSIFRFSLAPPTLSSIQEMQVKGVLISSSSVMMARKWPMSAYSAVPLKPARAKAWWAASGASKERNTRLEPCRATFSNAKNPHAVSKVNHDQPVCPSTLSLNNGPSSISARNPAHDPCKPKIARVAAKHQNTCTQTRITSR